MHFAKTAYFMDTWGNNCILTFWNAKNSSVSYNALSFLYTFCNIKEISVCWGLSALSVTVGQIFIKFHMGDIRISFLSFFIKNDSYHPVQEILNMTDSCLENLISYHNAEPPSPQLLIPSALPRETWIIHFYVLCLFRVFV
jgi:hypothetical protein